MELLDTLEERLKLHPKYGVGVAFSKEYLYLVRIEKEKDTWRISDFERIPCASEKLEIEEIQDVAELFHVHAMRMGKKTDNIAVVMPQASVFCCKSEFLGIAEEDLKEAVYWELEGRGYFGEEELRAAYRCEDETAGSYLLAAVSEVFLGEWERYWKEAGHEINYAVGCIKTVSLPERDALGILFDGTEFALGEMVQEIPCEALPALCAAMLSCGISQSACVDFAPVDGRETLDWFKINSLTAVLLACLLFICFSIDFCRTLSAEQAENRVHQDWCQMAKDREKMEALEEIRFETGKREKKLEGLSKESFPWRSVLVHFGSMTVEGVWLTEMGLTSKNVLEVKGEAVTFDALGDFLKKFEQDKDFFSELPILKESKVVESGEEKGAIVFSLLFHL